MQIRCNRGCSFCAGRRHAATSQTGDGSDPRRSPCLCPLRITRLSATRRRRRWLAAMGRSTGCVYRGSTPGYLRCFAWHRRTRSVVDRAGQPNPRDAPPVPRRHHGAGPNSIPMREPYDSSTSCRSAVRPWTSSASLKASAGAYPAHGPAAAVRLRPHRAVGTSGRCRSRGRGGSRCGVASHAGRAAWENSSTVADFSVGEDFRCPLCWWRQSHLPTPQPVDPMVSLEATEAYWQEWADRCTLKGNGATRSCGPCSRSRR